MARYKGPKGGVHIQGAPQARILQLDMHKPGVPHIPAFMQVISW